MDNSARKDMMGVGWMRNGKDALQIEPYGTAAIATPKDVMPTGAQGGLQTFVQVQFY